MPYAGKKILVLGGSSRIGACFIRHSVPGRVIATYRSLPPAGGVIFDATRQALDEIGLVFPEISHALILFAVPDPDKCLAMPEHARKLNVTATFSVIDELIKRGIQPIFMSSEAVFDGEKGDYNEADIANPKTYYGRMKREVEEYVADKDALILRISRVVGTRSGDRTMFTSWLSQLQNGETILCARDQLFSPIHEDDVVEAIYRLIGHGSRGLFHLSGPQGMSRLAMLEMLAEEFNRRGGRVMGRLQGCSIDDFRTPERRPRDVTMVCAKLRDTTGFTPRSVSMICEEAVKCATIGK